jgi:fructose-1,6-bisphosphatase/inositol monophosphatase family enzyme
MNQYLDFAKKIAYQAGEIMLKHFKVGVESTEKSDLTVVTAADKEINDLVIKEVNINFPEHSVCGEEKSLDKKTDEIWLCDPIDGTLPFSKGLAVSVFSLAYVKDGVPLVGVVYDPFTKRMYSAVKGEGAYLNDKLIRVSDKKLDYKATIDIEWWPEAEYDIDTACHKLSLDTGVYVLHLGSIIAASCMVATGQYEACVFAGTKGKSVDMAAIKVIVEEAGGKVTDIFGNNEKYHEDIKGAIISNSLNHDKLVEYLQN